MPACSRRKIKLDGKCPLNWVKEQNPSLVEISLEAYLCNLDSIPLLRRIIILCPGFKKAKSWMIFHSRIFNPAAIPALVTRWRLNVA